ncbi:MAG: hypothetical protein RLZZ04_1369 [Cyanobacteriota bacterium]
MTFADDFSADGASLEGEYPTAFGITFTPMIMGVAIAVAGLTLAIYGFVKFSRGFDEERNLTVTTKQY